MGYHERIEHLKVADTNGICAYLQFTSGSSFAYSLESLGAGVADQRNPASVLQDWGGDQLLLWKRYKALLLPFSKKEKKKAFIFLSQWTGRNPLWLGKKKIRYFVTMRE